MNAIEEMSRSVEAAVVEFCRFCISYEAISVDADAELTQGPTQDCPTPSRQKSSIGNGSRGIRLGQ
ncbi:hypothetical protein J2X84_002027 [Pseudomonas corrugata]|jgi:hypothetical protein|nr:hypothetical protein [Pseudomonas corrugata]